MEAAIVLEQSCYTPDAAATLKGFQFRYEHYRPYFWSAWIDTELIGITNGIRTSQTSCGDEMKGAGSDFWLGSHFCILTVAVHPEYRGQGIGRLLLKKLIQQCVDDGLESIILMCEEHLIPFYEAEQFELLGLSASNHGGIIWYEMRRQLHTLEHLAE
nr:GNAT family N-acetyltransferase [Paenibacillus castaneae]